MKIKRPNKFRQGQDSARMERYLAVELQNSLTDITTVLTRLTFDDNFKAERVTATILNGSIDTAVRHGLGVIPIGRIIIRSSSNDIIDGSTEWTKENIYLRCTGAAPQTISLIILG